MDSLKKSLIWFFIILLCGLPISFLAFGSDIQTQQSPLYPFQSSVFIQDEFMTGTATSGQIGSLGWGFGGAGSVTAIAGETGRPGLYRLATGAVGGQSARITFSGSTVFDSTAAHAMIWLNRLNTNDGNTTIRIGAITPASASPPTDGIYFEKLDADTNWFCVTRVGGVQTRTDTGVAVTTNFTRYSYTRNSTGVIFILGTENVCTHTTNVPGSVMTPSTFIITSAAASKTVDIDYYQIILNSLTR